MRFNLKLSAVRRAFTLPSLVCALLLFGGCGAPSLLVTPVMRSDRLEETRVDVPDKPGRERIVVIPIDGLIANVKTPSLLGTSENRISVFAQQLEKAARDDDVKAVVLRINSPGGTVTGSDTMYELVTRFRQKTGKPVIASCQEVAASGGYYIACAADAIVAQPTSIVGSIGVIFNSIHVDGLMSKIGLKNETIKSGPMKDMGSPFHPLSDEERKLMQQMVDEYYSRFTTVVRTSRKPTDEASFATSTDGRVMSGASALKVGLVDQLGLLEDAIQLARTKANAPRAVGVMYRKPFGPTGSVYANSPFSQGSEASTDPARIVLDFGEYAPQLPGGFYFLWRP